jgi:hypothetical protein
MILTTLHVVFRGLKYRDVAPLQVLLSFLQYYIAQEGHYTPDGIDERGVDT